MKNKINKVKVGTYKDFSGTIINIINTNLNGDYSTIGYCSCHASKNVDTRTYSTDGVFNILRERTAPRTLDLDLSTYIKPKSKYRPGKLEISIENKNIVPGIYKNEAGDTIEVVKILEDSDTNYQ